jgi:hypothetical protein
MTIVGAFAGSTLTKERIIIDNGKVIDINYLDGVKIGQIECDDTICKSMITKKDAINSLFVTDKFTSDMVAIKIPNPEYGLNEDFREEIDSFEYIKREKTVLELQKEIESYTISRLKTKSEKSNINQIVKEEEIIIVQREVIKK